MDGGREGAVLRACGRGGGMTPSCWGIGGEAVPPQHARARPCLRNIPGPRLQDAQQAARAWFGAGVAADMQGEGLRALGLFARALELTEDQGLRARALVAKASVHHALGQKAEAVDLLKDAAKIDPKVPGRGGWVWWRACSMTFPFAQAGSGLGGPSQWNETHQEQASQRPPPPPMAVLAGGGAVPGAPAQRGRLQVSSRSVGLAATPGPRCRW